MKDKAIMDECYGKQIDYYNQFPNSSKVIEKMVERLEKAESKNEKYEKYLFSQLENFEREGCHGEFIIYYSDGDASGGGCWDNVKLTLKIDKEKKQIMIDIYKKYKHEWVINPNNIHFYKLKERNDENVKKVTYEYIDESELPTTAILYVKDSDSIINFGVADLWGHTPEDSSKPYWLSFNNKADWEERRRREISHIQIDEKYKNDKNFQILFELIGNN